MDTSLDAALTGWQTQNPIRTRRDTQGMSRLALALAAGINSPTSILDWEMGRSTPRAASLAALETALGCRPGTLGPALATWTALRPA